MRDQEPMYPSWVLIHPDDVRRTDAATVEVAADCQMVTLNYRDGRKVLPLFSTRDKAIDFTQTVEDMGPQALLSITTPAEMLDRLESVRGRVADVVLNPSGDGLGSCPSWTFDEFYAYVERSRQ